MSASSRNWVFWTLLVLSLEKVVQHAFVTMAFLGDFRGIRDTVAVDYRWLVVTGVFIGILYALAATEIVRGRSWGRSLLAGLAAADIVGEFIAQGTLSITITVSFIVAWIVLVLALRLSTVSAPSNA